jgi:hypothetical protein
MSNFPPNGLIPQDLIITGGAAGPQHFTEAPVLVNTVLRVGETVRTGVPVQSGVDTATKHKALEDSRPRPA